MEGRLSVNKLVRNIIRQLGPLKTLLAIRAEKTETILAVWLEERHRKKD